MEIRNDFEVDAKPADTYDALVDLERVGPCIPGATIGPAADDGSHPAQIAVKLGPMRMTYKGTVRLVEHDAATHRAVLAADVKETRGQGSARATMTMTVAEEHGHARVSSLTDVQMTGRAAQMGRGIIEDVAGRLVREMAGNLSAELAPAAEPPAAGGAGDGGPGPAGTGAATAGEGAPATGEPQVPSGPPPRQPAKPVNGLSLLWKVLVDRVRRLFKRPTT